MDKETRGYIERATQKARRLLEEEFAAQLEGDFDIHRNGAIAEQAGVHLTPRQVFQRTRIIAAIDHKRAAGMPAPAAVADYLRDAAFTTLNRFAALKMLEARQLVQECITRGEESSGYREFCGMAPGLPLLPDSAGYRLYIECLFDELSTGLKVLFNRRDAASVLWPRRATFLELLETLNQPMLGGVWGEDETIGWIYQYYNDGAERKKMREESATPRNSRELAVRNQFFTPRYVVEFLTDNTLGRLWYEMTQGQTRLKEQCRYLVRRPNEIFLAPDEAIPPGENVEDSLSQEALLQQPVYIPHRPLKDPREIRLLDPACGSMHFGLYAFDLFMVIYAEAWDLNLAATDGRGAGGEGLKPLRELYATQDDYLRDVPRLIIEHNLHGIDIDPRAAQIAALSLWLRAQRAWNNAGVKPADRPRIRRSNIVCAEPMPGEKVLLRDFVERQFPTHEQPAFTFLLEKIFDRMALAGEAGSLLRIEEEIRSIIAEAHALAHRQSAPQQLPLFPDREPPAQTQLDLRGLTDEQFWEGAETRIYAALEAYAQQAVTDVGFQCRLFAEDAAQGFAFIDLCRKKYDVVVMNPPFGECPTIVDLRSYNEACCENILCAFVTRAFEMLVCNGISGCVSDATVFTKSSYERFRKLIWTDTHRLYQCANLGWGVLDGANVEVGLMLLRMDGVYSSFSSLDSRNKPEEQLLRFASEDAAISFAQDRTLLHVDSKLLNWIPNISFPMSDDVLVHIGAKRLCEKYGDAKQGVAPVDSFRVMRLRSEVEYDLLCKGKTWWPVNRGGGYSPFYRSFSDVLNWANNGAELKEDILRRYPYLDGNTAWVAKNEDFYGKAGVCYGKRTEFLSSQILPQGVIITVEGIGAYPKPAVDPFLLLGVLNTPSIAHILNTFCGQHKYSGYVDNIPVPDFTAYDENRIKNLAYQGFELCRSIETKNELDPLFCIPWIHAKRIEEAEELINHQARSSESRLHGILDELDFITHAYWEKVTPSILRRYQSDANDWSRSTLLGWCVGFAFGRWDIRYATGERPVPGLPEPFAPLPVCPPGMLQGDDGLPLSPEDGRKLRAEGRYPLNVVWEGILVDDPEHPLDIERRIHDALAIIWGDRADAIQQEACELLGVKSLREWFRKPAGFFADHLKRYSKSRRQAPLYWPLSSPGGRYTLWLYYHRFGKDTLYRALELTQDKVQFEERTLQRLTGEAGANPGAADRATLAEQEAFVTELRTFQEELTRVAPLWNPDLNDGVILNYGPLWRMIGLTPWQKAVKAKWEELVAGDYDWAHLAMHLWPERVVPKCAKDRSLAIAHGLDEVFWVEDDKGKWTTRDTPTRPIEDLVRDRSSTAVKSALASLLEAPVAATTRGRRGRTART